MLQKNLAIIFIALFAVSCSSKLNKEQSLATSQAAAEIKEKKHGEAVFFDYDSFVLTSHASSTLDEKVLPSLKENTNMRATIEGHCDERGTIAYNKRLGKNRANAVKSYLVKNGVAASRIRTESYGKSRPIDLGHDENAWAKNRRAVTISVK